MTGRGTSPVRQDPSAEPATVDYVDDPEFSPPALTVICAWCETVVSGPGDGPVSHGICRACACRFLERLPLAYLEAIADADGTVTLFSGYRFRLAEVRQDGRRSAHPGEGFP
ncbi:hypothetical protein A9A59_0559 [Tepidiforma thermophila]|uniref:Uncharacterized protein n=1 Tax=Tepidiforma thermophila (strain KCTC 52669 / CGMCC 1.13589 / G233) TaxID=2761530 RepID=A0A2A9HBN8_TEPT2|nr:hypothetical protein A9A59_0559 [Tepidiforma thermophila]